MQDCHDLGTLPGMWHAQEWRPFTTECQLRQWPDVSQRQPLRVLLFGDSIERLTAQDLSDSNATVCCYVRGEVSAECDGQCRANASLNIETLHNNGVWPTGPYFMDEALPLSAAQAFQQVGQSCPL